MVDGLVSVVIPTYNRAKLLQEAVSSCLDQEYSSIEVLIVDDGSTDDTCLIIEQLLHGEWLGRPVKYWKIQNSGAAAARQFGLDRASGEFVQFLDSDDLICSKKLKRQVETFQASDRVADCCTCFGRKGPREAGWGASERIGFCGEDVSEFVRAMCSPKPFPMASTAPLWRLEFLRRQPGWPEKITCGEDWFHYTRLLLEVRHVLFVDDELFWARDHSGERLSNTSDRPLRPSQVRSFAVALDGVIEEVQKSKYFDVECRKGLLNIAATIYALMLRARLSDDFEWFEKSIERLDCTSAVNVRLSLIIRVRYFLGDEVASLLVNQYLAVREMFRRIYVSLVK